MKNEVTHGKWSEEEKTEHINVLELKAAMLGVLSLCRNLHDCHIRIELDNTTAVSYINNMGGTPSFKCNKLSRQLILWCEFKRIYGSQLVISLERLMFLLIDIAVNDLFTRNGPLMLRLSTRHYSTSDLWIGLKRERMDN